MIVPRQLLECQLRLLFMPMGNPLPMAVPSVAVAPGSAEDPGKRAAILKVGERVADQKDACCAGTQHRHQDSPRPSSSSISSRQASQQQAGGELFAPGSITLTGAPIATICPHRGIQTGAEAVPAAGTEYVVDAHNVKGMTMQQAVSCISQSLPRVMTAEEVAFRG